MVNVYGVKTACFGHLPNSLEASTVQPSTVATSGMVRDKRGRFGVTHGNSNSKRKRLDERAALISARLDEVIADLGGVENTSAVGRGLAQRHAETTTLADLALLHILRSRQPVSPETTTALDAYVRLASIQIRIATQLGLARRTRRVDVGARLRAED